MIRKFLIAIALATPLFADQVAVSKFGLLNNNSPATAIANSQAQDLLNVDVTPGGLSVKKRPGYGIYKALGSGQSMHGGYHAFDSSNNDYQLWGTSTSLYGIVADGTPTQLVSSATLNSTWDCADTQGNSYCVDSSRDVFLRTNGTTKTWFTTPLGTMVESTPDRVIVSGVSGSPNTLFVSQSNTFTNFTTGINSTDPFTEVIASPGSHITHIRWGCGKLLWWKDASFGYFDFDDQFSAQIKTVSDTIGTLDNTSAIDPGGRVWFRGQDGHTWMYDCSSLTKQSIDITPDVQASGKRTQNSWNISTQAEFNTGTIVPTGQLSTTISPNDVVPSSFTIVENSSAQWNSDSSLNLTINPSSFTLANNNRNINDSGFENGSGGILSSAWVSTSTWGTNIGYALAGDPCSPAVGSGFAFTQPSIGNTTFGAAITDVSGNILSSATVPISLPTGSCLAYSTTTISSAGILGNRIKVMFTDPSGFQLTSQNSYTLGGDITFEYAGGRQSNIQPYYLAIDNILGGSTTITTGYITSVPYDLIKASQTVQLVPNAIVFGSTPTWAVQTATSATGGWATIMTSSGTNSTANEFVRYSSTLTFTGGTTIISTVAFVSASTGTYYSAVHNAPNLTGWSTFGATTNNAPTQSFFMRASTNTFSVLSSTPAWTAQTAGSLVTISTGTFFQVRDDFAVPNATATSVLNDFSVNWFEGTSSDQAYMLYFDNAIWESVAFGAGQSANDYIFKYDLINNGWTLYSFGAGGLLAASNTLYFGSPTTGTVYSFGTNSSDNGSSIQAYWKSKEFSGQDVFLQSQLTNIDTFAKKSQGASLIATYTIENSTSTSYSISLSTGNNAYIGSRKLLPPGKTGYTFDYQLGDTSTLGWEILGFRIGFQTLPYTPSK